MQDPFRIPGRDRSARSSVDLGHLLHVAVEGGASDVHLKVGQPPIVRFDGHLEPLEGWEPFEMPALAYEPPAEALASALDAAKRLETHITDVREVS